MNFSSIENLYSQFDHSIQNKLKRFHVELLRFNKAINLISSASVEAAEAIHIGDGIQSLITYQGVFGQIMNSQIYDLGSGNGVPGVIWGILFDPSNHMHLVESDSRKSEYLKWIVRALELPNVSILNSRFENVSSQNALYLSRGFSSLTEIIHLVERSSKMMRPEIIALKSDSLEAEWRECTSEQRSTWNMSVLEYQLLNNHGHRKLAILKPKTSI